MTVDVFLLSGFVTSSSVFCLVLNVRGLFGFLSVVVGSAQCERKERNVKKKMFHSVDPA